MSASDSGKERERTTRRNREEAGRPEGSAEGNGLVGRLGVQPATLYLRSGGGFAFFRDGAHADIQNSPGAGGVTAMSLDSSSNLSVTGSVAADGALSSRGTNVIKNATTCCPAGSSQVGADLNQGSGGAFCYLCIQRAN